jgi:hypothetical protein
MRLNVENEVPTTYNLQPIKRIFKRLQDQLNLLSEGRLVAKNNAVASVPTTGDYAVGDFVPNSTISELGAGGSKYILDGWVCVDADPLTFVEKRCLTGN